MGGPGNLQQGAGGGQGQGPAAKARVKVHYVYVFSVYLIAFAQINFVSIRDATEKAFSHYMVVWFYFYHPYEHSVSKAFSFADPALCHSDSRTSVHRLWTKYGILNKLPIPCLLCHHVCIIISAFF